ncbi:MAG: hypothetical protein FJ087_12950 [Deltaproteobacteria bacterium]|nr:hypothetical protein [Deltaproteobacteria bacterium]
MPAKKGGTRAAASNVAVEVAGGAAVVVVHKELYPADVLFGTAFAFLDRAFVHLDVVDADRTRIELTARPGVDAATIGGEFKNELVTQAVRLKLAQDTGEVRTMIVGRAIAEAVPIEQPPAFSDRIEPELPPEVAKILAEEEDALDFLDDPLGIAVPWEDKYGKDKPAPAKDGDGAEKAP